jgi:hypothetical protein
MLSTQFDRLLLADIAFSLTFLTARIIQIILMCSKEEMARIDANPIVARMTDEQAVWD